MKKIENEFKILTFLLVVLFSGCSEDLLNEETPQLATTESIYSSLSGFESGINGLYNQVRVERAGNYHGDYYRPNGLTADMYQQGNDNLTANGASMFGETPQDWANKSNSSNIYYKEYFIWLYQVVNSANTVINQAESRTDVDWRGNGSTEEENKIRIIAEAKAIRGWAYRHLTYLWGDVPLSLEESLGSTIKTDWQRTLVSEVRRQMISDWLFAEKHIGVEPSSPGKITKGAIQTYLSEMYLTIGKPDSALYWADKCINTPEYQLITSRYGVKKDEPGVVFMDMFYDGNSLRNQGNTECLWGFEFEYGVVGGENSIMRRWISSEYSYQKVGGVNPIQITYDRGGRGGARLGVTKFALDIYEPTDDRFSNYAIRKYFILKTAEQNAPIAADILPPGYEYGDTIHLKWDVDISPTNRKVYNWPFVRKFEGAPADNPTYGYQYNDQVYMRLAETYMLKAEAQYKLGNSAGAAQTINIIRARSHASPVTASQIDIDFILDERSRELILEEQRRYTLLRTGTWLERVQKYNHNGGQTASARDTLYPIPQVVIDANLTVPMKQNPGY